MKASEVQSSVLPSFISRILISTAVLRLLPPVPLNFRVAAKDTSLPVGGGPDGKSPIYVKKGEHVNYSVYSMHRRTDFWGPDAHLFRPERWEENQKHGWDYLPFNGGPRICLGRKSLSKLCGIRSLISSSLSVLRYRTICPYRG
jgi:hypothetical protein